MLVCVTVELTSTTGEAPLTVTVSWSAPTPISTSRRVVRFTSTTALRLTSEKPVKSKATSYGPGGSDGSW